ncbi:uncharacterized protein LOC106665020 isoform X2 [Cimex lectularius]|nr:uncharacterized protein LOC106665020 isoform X2 [Cimex lectularius]
MRFVCELLFETGLGNPLHMSILAILSVSAYFVFISSWKRKMKNEIILFKVWELCINHLFNMLRQPLHNIKIFKENKRGILKQENVKKSGHYKVMFESILVVHTYTPFSSSNKLVPDTETPSESNSPGIWRKIIDFLCPFSNSTANMPDKNEEDKGEIQYLDETSPAVVKLVEEQTNMFFKTLIYFIPGVFMSNAIAFLMLTTVNQAEFSSRNRTHWWADMDLQWYSAIFDIILFPLNEFIVYPILRKRNFSNLHIYLTGYLALTLVVMCSLVVQIQLEDELHFMPEEYTSNLRIFNTLPYSCTINIAGFINDTEVEPFEYALETGVPVGKSAKLWVTITEKRNTTESSRTYPVSVKARKSISVIITKNGLFQNGDYDPTLFPAGEINNSVSSFFVIHGLTSLKESPSLNFIETKTLKNTAFRIERGIQHEINAGTYTLEIKEGNKTSSEVNNVVINGAMLYVVFIYDNESEVLTGNVFLLEGPVTLQYYYLILQVFLSNVAQVLSSVAYFTFMFEQSPPKLRGGIFTILSVIQLLGLSFLTYYTKMKHFFSYSKLITVYASIFVFIYILNVYFIV